MCCDLAILEEVRVFFLALFFLRQSCHFLACQDLMSSLLTSCSLVDMCSPQPIRHASGLCPMLFWGLNDLVI